MYQIFARIRLILTILVGIFIFSIDDGLWFFALGGAALVYFVFLSNDFLTTSTKDLEKTLSSLDTPKASQIPDIVQEKIQLAQDEYLGKDLGEALNQDGLPSFPMKQWESTHKENITLHTQDEYSSSRSEYQDAPWEPNAIERFFSENLLAKLWGILVFLWVLFLLSLIYSVIGPVAKMCIWLAIGFLCYGAGVWMDKKWYTNESRIVMGTAILINYLVILSWRHILWNDSSSDTTLLSVWITFVFLILNTIFAVVTSLVYNSRALLIFAFIFAYLNPLLLWSSSNEPYTLLGYTMIVTAWAMYMAYIKRDEILFPVSFILAAIMFVIAPWSDGAWWTVKLLSINTLGVMSLYVSTVFEKKYQYLGEILIAGTFFLIWVMGFLWIASLSSLQLTIMWISSIGLMLLSYLNMNKWAYLYSIWTLGTVLTLTPVILTNGLRSDTLVISAWIIWVFALCNIGVILTKSKELLAGNLWNIISWLVSGALFLTFMIYHFGNIYFPWVAQWFVFFFLAIIYCLLAFIAVQKVGIEELKGDEKYQNTFYTISALWVSLFSLAVAFVFAEDKEVISIIWLLEASVLFYLANKTRSQKVALWALILFAIWIFEYITFIDMRFERSYGLIVGCLIVFWCIFHTLISVSNKKFVFRENQLFIWMYNLLHITWIFSAALVIIIVSNIENEFISLLWAWSSAVGLYYIYQFFQSRTLIFFSKWMILCVCFVHTILISEWIKYSSVDFLLSLAILTVPLSPVIYDYFHSQKVTSPLFSSTLWIYVFIVTSLYIYQLFGTTFANTLYWWVLAFIFLWYGISKNILPLRTLWLYLITLTAGKVFLYDIWTSVDGTVSRVIVLIIVWILMIVLSTMYTRKYGNTLNSEFSPTNLFDADSFNSKNTPSSHTQETTQEKVITHEEQKSWVMQEIEKTDVSKYSAVRMKISGVDKSFTIRAINLIKIAKIIESDFGKTVFTAWELSEIQSSVLSEYKSELPESQYNKLKEVVAAFVEHGGEIEFIRKK